VAHWSNNAWPNWEKGYPQLGMGVTCWKWVGPHTGWCTLALNPHLPVAVRRRGGSKAADLTVMQYVVPGSNLAPPGWYAG
jgi:hypothetical protein